MTSICILGVDGSGKSTIVNKLGKLYGDKIAIKYMGTTDAYMETEAYKKMIYKLKNEGVERNSFDVLKNTMINWFELKHRVESAKAEKKEFVIFDRYAWDVYVRSNSTLKRLALKLLFYHLFPKPKLVFYLHCSVECSLSRKDDIIDEEEFKRIKSLWDSAYLGLKQNGVEIIDTEKIPEEKVISYIVERIGLQKSKEK